MAMPSPPSGPGGFEWVTFFRLAEELVGRPSEADQRTAMSRAYYAAFHQWRRVAVDAGASFPRSGDVHRKVVEWMRGHRMPAVRVMGAKLSRLRLIRNKADYEDRALAPEYVEQAMSLARALLSRWLS
jgi:uncharacterized protein (UPF0332 family)